MAVLVQTLQSVLPIELFTELQRVRSRYAPALKLAAAGDYSRAADLRSVSRLVGRFVAREAKKSPEQRGGLRMSDISLAVDGLFPELRGWNQLEIARHQRDRMRQSSLPQKAGSRIAG